MKKEIIKNMPVRNSGLIFEEPKPEDYVLGYTSPLQNKVIFKDGHGWLDFQRPEERQFNRNFDSFSCVTFSCLKALSYYFKVVYNLDMNFSERFTASMSGTIPGRGNSVRNVLESIRKQGFVLESDYPSMADNMTEAEWFKYPPKSVRDKALANLKKWKITWEVLSTNSDVPHDLVNNALQYAVAIVTGYAWASYFGHPDDVGIYKDYNYQANHCFLVIDWQHPTDWDELADDSYPQDNRYDDMIVDKEFLKKLSPDYRIWSAHAITVTPLVEQNTSLINKLKSMFTKIVRDIHGGLWFVKNDSKQKIEDWLSFAGAVIDEVGCKTVDDNYLSNLKDIKFFGK